MPYSISANGVMQHCSISASECKGRMPNLNKQKKKKVKRQIFVAFLACAREQYIMTLRAVVARTRIFILSIDVANVCVYSAVCTLPSSQG